MRDSGERHTSANSAKELRKAADDFNIAKTISGYVTDNATNASNAADQFTVGKGVRCDAHTTRVCVREGTALPAVKETLGRNAILVAHFKHSTVAMGVLRSAQTQFYKKGKIVQLAQRCSTRFDTDYHMCHTSNRNKAVMNAVLGDRSVTKLSQSKCD